MRAEMIKPKAMTIDSDLIVVARNLSTVIDCVQQSKVVVGHQIVLPTGDQQNLVDDINVLQRQLNQVKFEIMNKNPQIKDNGIVGKVFGMLKDYFGPGDPEGQGSKLIDAYDELTNLKIDETRGMRTRSRRISVMDALLNAQDDRALSEQNRALAKRLAIILKFGGIR